MTFLVVLGLAGSTVVVAAVYVQRTLVAPIDRIEGVFTGLPDRPTKPGSGAGADALNILFLGTDRRSEAQTTGSSAQEPTWVPGAQRTDAMLLVHVAADRDEVSVVSLPRDSWVEIPGHGYGKINAAFSYGGARLAVATVERLTQVRIDHLAVIDWEGLRQLTDALGGVTIDVPETVHDSAHDITWTAGAHELDGEEALLYVSQRYGLAGGDLDRARRQQNLLRVLLSATLERVREGGPLEVIDLLGVITDNLSIDEGWSTSELGGLVWSLRDLDKSGVTFLTAPVAGLAMEGAQSVVHLDVPLGRTLWSAVRADSVADWVRDHPDVVLTDTVR